MLERGHIFFFYRPRVDRPRVRHPRDVQRVHLILRPTRRRVIRRLIIGKKHLPDPSRHERLWGFVDEVTDRPEEIEDELDRQEYETATRGLRLQPEARPAGEGVYAIVRHGDHTHLVYELELPRRPGAVQEELKIEDAASYIIALRNPRAPSPPGLGLRKVAVRLPPELRDRFGARRFIPADPPALLDFEGIEFVLIGATDQPDRELGIRLDAEQERGDRADIFRVLKLERDAHPLEPLLRGEWR